MIDLCEGCGLCCNGTLFNYVTLVSDDLPKLAKYSQLRLELRNGQDSFNEPCILHTGKGCSAYDDRPDACSRYLCGVLLSVAKDELTELEAVSIIREARALVENVKELIVFPPEEPLAVSTWTEPPEGVTEEARLAWERTAHHLQKYFLQTLPKDAPAADHRRPVPEGSQTSCSGPPRGSQEKPQKEIRTGRREPTW